MHSAALGRFSSAVTSAFVLAVVYAVTEGSCGQWRGSHAAAVRTVAAFVSRALCSSAHSDAFFDEGRRGVVFVFWCFLMGEIQFCFEIFKSQLHRATVARTFIQSSPLGLHGRGLEAFYDGTGPHRPLSAVLFKWGGGRIWTGGDPGAPGSKLPAARLHEKSLRAAPEKMQARARALEFVLFDNRIGFARDQRKRLPNDQPWWGNQFRL